MKCNGLCILFLKKKVFFICCDIFFFKKKKLKKKKNKKKMAKYDWQEALPKIRTWIIGCHGAGIYPIEIIFYDDDWKVKITSEPIRSYTLDEMLLNFDQNISKIREKMKTGLYSRPSSFKLTNGHYVMISNNIPSVFGGFEVIHFDYP